MNRSTPGQSEPVAASTERFRLASVNLIQGARVGTTWPLGAYSRHLGRTWFVPLVIGIGDVYPGYSPVPHGRLLLVFEPDSVALCNS